MGEFNRIESFCWLYKEMATSETASKTPANEAHIGKQPQPSFPYLMPITKIGGKKGKLNYFYGDNDGSMLGKIGVWVKDRMIKAITVWLTNGLCQEFGKQLGAYHEYSFQPGELITAMSLWPNRDGDRLGAIKFKTSKGNEFFQKKMT